MATAIYDTSTGRLISITSEDLSNVGAGQSKLDLVQIPDISTQMWDTVTRNFIARPIKTLVDRVQDLRNDGSLSAVWTRLTATQQTALINRLQVFLGKMRWRNPGESVDIA